MGRQYKALGRVGCVIPIICIGSALQISEGFFFLPPFWGNRPYYLSRARVRFSLETEN